MEEEVRQELSGPTSQELHEAQLEEPGGENAPGAQGEQSSVPGRENVPLGHRLHVAAPDKA